MKSKLNARQLKKTSKKGQLMTLSFNQGKVNAFAVVITNKAYKALLAIRQQSDGRCRALAADAAAPLCNSTGVTLAYSRGVPYINGHVLPLALI